LIRAPRLAYHECDHAAYGRQSLFEGTFEMKTTGLEQARAAKERIKAFFADRASVVSVGITRVNDGYGVKVNLCAPLDADADLPKTIDGVPIRVEVVGPVRKR
jgi:hypothetical protein